jgi:hypothetical protein
MHTCTPITLDNVDITLDNPIFTLDLIGCWEDYIEVEERLVTDVVCNLHVADSTYGITIVMDKNVNYCLLMDDSFNLALPMEVIPKYSLEFSDILYGITMIVEDTFNYPVILLECG